MIAIATVQKVSPATGCLSRRSGDFLCKSRRPISTLSGQFPRDASRVTRLHFQQIEVPDVSTFATAVSAAPEPSTWLLMFPGIGGIGLMLRRAKKTTAFQFRSPVDQPTAS